MSGAQRGSTFLGRDGSLSSWKLESRLRFPQLNITIQDLVGRFQILNPAQCQAIVTFLKARLQDKQGSSSLGEQRVIRRALENYWLDKTTGTNRTG